MGQFKDTNRLKVKEWKKIYHANSNHKKAEMDILILDKNNIKTNQKGLPWWRSG